MLIKYKTEPTIIVLSPNSANLIKILTQFVYSINIRYFSPSSLPCPVTLQGITYKIGAEAKGKYISSSAVPRSITGCFVQQNIGEVSHSDGGVNKTERLKNSDSNKPSITLSPCHASQHYGVSRSNIEGEGENVLYCYIENTSDCKERHVSHSSPVFCAANIGEVAEGRRG